MTDFVSNEGPREGASNQAASGELFSPEAIRTAVRASIAESRIVNAPNISTAGNGVLFASTASDVQKRDGFVIPKLPNTSRSGDRSARDKVIESHSQSQKTIPNKPKPIGYKPKPAKQKAVSICKTKQGKAKPNDTKEVHVNESNEQRFQNLEKALEKQNLMLEKLCEKMSSDSTVGKNDSVKVRSGDAQVVQQQAYNEYMEELTLDDGSFEPDYEYPYEHEDDGNCFSLPSAQDKVENIDHVVEVETDLATGHAGDIVSPILAKGFAGRFQTQAPLGPDANDELVDSLNIMLSERLGMENMTTLMDKYVPPNNIPNLVVPKVNPLIWDNIPAKTKSRDLRLQKLQKPLIKGLIAVTNLMKEKSSPEQEEALALLAHANYEVNMFRRESIRPELNPKYQPLCRPEVKVTQHLFGEDLGKVVKDMTEQQKAVSVTKMGTLKFKEQRYSPYSGSFIRPTYPGRGRGNQNSPSAPSFLGSMQNRGRGLYPRGRGRGWYMRGQRKQRGSKAPATQSRPLY